MVGKNKNESKQIKILQIGSFKNLWDEEGIAKSFEKLGHKVIRVPEESFRVADASKVLELENPDFVLIAKFKAEMELDKALFFKKCRSMKIPIITWVWDLYFGLRREFTLQRDWMFRSDLVLTPDGGNQKKFEELGINHRVLRQAIYDEYCYEGEFQEKYDYDIVFVGCSNMQWSYSEQLGAFLQKEYGDRFKWFGRFDTHEIRGDDLNNLYKSAKIIIGDSVYSPYYWSNRLYETLGRGGFTIFPKIDGLESDYEAYKHYIPYRMGDWKGLKEKINYFLCHENERERIKKEALKHTKENHTLLQRCQELLKFISQITIAR